MLFIFGVVIFAILIGVLSFLYLYELLGRTTMLEELHQKAVLITGCGGGFGKELVMRCLHNGHTVFAGCHRESSVEELMESCAVTRGKLYAFQMDVSDDASVLHARQLVDNVLRDNNLVLHAVVNNAGVRGNHFYDDFLTLEDYKAVWEVNVYGAIRVTQTFKDLIKQSRGRIVMCGSACMLFAIPCYGPYASSKAALGAYTDVIRHELRPYGVRVILVLPGSFESGMQDTKRLLDMMDSVWDRSSQKIRDEYGNDYIIKAKAVVERLQSTVISKDTTWVTNAYYEAISAKRPKLLYRVGWDTALFFYPYSFLSLSLQLWVMRFLLFMNGVPEPAVIKKITNSRR